MSWENTDDLAKALPTVNGDNTQAEDTVAAPKINPQAAGWVPATGYDYETYNKSTKELHEAMVAQGAPSAEEILGGVGAVITGDWSSNAAVYEWSDDFGDVGPPFPALEKQLFASENHMQTGIKFDEITKLEVVQEGPIRIQPVLKFEDAGLHPVMLRNVQLAGYHVPTPIQMYTLPAIFKGHDVVACAQTGSGKTAAFLIPILSKLMGKAKKLCAPRPNPAMVVAGAPPVRAEPLVLIVAPTRELATQIFDEARRFCYRTMFRPCVVYGGGPISEQIQQIAKGCDVLIGTPGRLCDFLDRPQLLTLKRLKYMVIDEADEMVSNDWDTELRKIMSGGDQEEGNINYLMFSATFPKMARDLAKHHLAHDHVRFRVGRVGSTTANIKQDILDVDPQNKRKCLTDLLIGMPPCRTIIFVNSKRTCDEIDDHLFNLAFPCTSIHSDRTQREREDSIRAFRTGKMPILIATGVSARGLDIHNVNHIINFDLPSTNYGGIQEYIHRIGRTGRIGNLGVATSFYNSRDEDLAPMLVKVLLETKQAIPDFLSSYLPDGFTVEEGFAQGDVGKIDWEDDSDDGEGDEAANGEGGAVSGGWGEPAATTLSGWGTETTAQPAQSGGGWGTETTAQSAQSGGGWGTGTTAQPAQSSSGWGTETTAQPVQPSSSWGTETIAQPAQSGGWGAASQAYVNAQVQATTPPIQAPSQGWNAAPAVSQPSSWGAPQVASRQSKPAVSGTNWNTAPTTPPQQVVQPAVSSGWGNQGPTKPAYQQQATQWGAPGPVKPVPQPQQQQKVADEWNSGASPFNQNATW